MQSYLENPAWEALGTYQQQLNEGTDTVRYYPANVSPFVALQDWDEANKETLRLQLPDNRNFSVVIAKQVELPAWCEMIFTIPLYQMVCTAFKPVEDAAVAIQPLTEEHIPMMLELTAATKPGPFFNKTISFGNYYGIMHGEQLVSMAGQRMQTHTHTEVSAICTDPAYLGKGYASLLTTVVCKKVIEAGKTPFLHVRQDNAGAIKLYQKLGFEIAAEVYFAVFRKK